MTPEQCADWIVPADATKQEVEAIADEAAWKMPCKIFCVRKDDRLAWFLQRLDSEYCMTADDYIVRIQEEEMVNDGH